MNKGFSESRDEGRALVERAQVLLSATADAGGKRVEEARGGLAAALEHGRQVCGMVRSKVVESADAWRGSAATTSVTATERTPFGPLDITAVPRISQRREYFSDQDRYGGILYRAYRADDPLQLLNPFAPREYQRHLAATYETETKKHQCFFAFPDCLSLRG